MVNNSRYFLQYLCIIDIIDEKTDSGGWGTKSQHCMGLPDEIISWGGPIAVFRWDNAKDVDIKDFSVREIQDTN